MSTDGDAAGDCTGVALPEPKPVPETEPDAVLDDLEVGVEKAESEPDRLKADLGVEADKEVSDAGRVDEDGG